MSPPEPMLSSAGRRWPTSREWVMEPKWDGFRLLIEVDHRGDTRAWSRHGANLTARLGALLECFGTVPAGTTFDGELVALASRSRHGRAHTSAPASRSTSKPTNRSRSVAGASPVNTARVTVAKSCTGWPHRSQRLRGALPTCERVRAISSQPASPEAHSAIVALGFEGTVLKRPRSTYRSGRHAAWVKHKARHVAEGSLLDVRQGRDGDWRAVCEVDDRRVTVLTGSQMASLIGRRIELAYSRVDADGGLREARITTSVPS